MDKVIYKGVIVLVCIMLAIILIATPIWLDMYVRNSKREQRMNETEIRIEKKLKELERETK